MSSGKIETTANVATIIAALLLSVALAKSYLLPGATVRRLPAPPVVEAAAGTSLRDRLPGVDWSRNRQTLVLAISTQCHFCTESAPFFRQLEQETGKNVTLLAVLPESISEAQDYLKSQNLHIDQIKQAGPGNIGIRGTPTMLLVDHSGVVTKVWTGMLQPEQQTQVLSMLKRG